MIARVAVPVLVLGDGRRQVRTPPSPTPGKRYDYVGASWNARGDECAVFELRDLPASPGADHAKAV